MAYEQRPNTGTLFPNDRKEKDTHPDWKGTINVNGVEHWFSAWTKQGQRGEFLSVSIGEKKEPKPVVKQQADTQDRPSVVLDDDIPF
jgi:hypothetical protein